MTTMDISDELREKKNNLGISYTRLIEFGVKFIENQKESNDEFKQMQKNIQQLQVLLRGANQRILTLEAQNDNSEAE